MKRNKLVIGGLAAVVGIFMMSGAAMAAAIDTNPTVQVDATVIPMCKWVADGAMAFNIDPSLAGPLSFATPADGTAPSIKCSNGTTANVTCPATVALGTITAGITCPATVAGTGFSAAVDIPITLSIAQAQYEDKAPGLYAGNFTVQVNY